MSARAVRRRRTRPSIAVRVRTLWVVALLGAFAIAAVVVAAVDAPQLRVRAVRADVADARVLRAADVIAAAHVDADANLWLLDTGAIRRRIEALPYALDARVQRAQFPQPSIAFEVSVRVPTGCVRTSDGAVTIDATARVLQTGCSSIALPLVEAGSGAGARPGERLTTRDIERLLTDAKTIGDRVPVRIVRRDRWGGLEATDTDGVVLRFGGDDDLARKLLLVEPIRRSIAKARKLRAIDLRAPDTPVVEFP